jgi:hypothetical protein
MKVKSRKPLTYNSTQLKTLFEASKINLLHQTFQNTNKSIEGVCQASNKSSTELILMN